MKLAMATSATTTTSTAACTFLFRRHMFVGTSFSNNYISFARKPTVTFSVRCSGNDLSSSSAATTDVEGPEESKIEVPKGPPPSLISALNVEKALRGIGTLFFVFCLYILFDQNMH